MGRLVLDVHVLRTAVDVRVVLNLRDPTDGLHEVKARIPPGSCTGTRWLRVALEKVRPIAHLVEEAVVVAVTGSRVGASGTHRGCVTPARRPRVRDESLLFLQHDEDGLLTNATGFGDLVDDCGCGFVRSANI